jgi:hypothetical protein
MNDFTKEELKLIHGSLEANIRIYMEPDCIYILRDKLQSMIDSYREEVENDPN